MKKYFLTGLVTLLPLAVTLWVVRFVVDLLTHPFVGLVSYLVSHSPYVPGHIVFPLSRLLILVSLFLFIVFLGFVARRIFFGKVILLGERLLIHIPIVSKIYKTSKNIIKTLFGSEEKSFQQVVLFRFPSTECYALALVAKAAPKSCADQAGDESLVSLFLPMALNPATGTLVMAKKQDLIYLNMRTEAALKYVLSCGVIPTQRSDR